MESTAQKRNRLGLCRWCGKKQPKTRKTHKSCRKAVAVYGKKHRDKYKKLCFDLYGGKCECCGERNHGFLTIDHINNDGHKEKLYGAKMYSKLVLRGKRLDLRLLCYNCNMGRAANSGICPHEH